MFDIFTIVRRVRTLVRGAAVGTAFAMAGTAVMAQQASSVAQVSGSEFNVTATADSVVVRSRAGELINGKGGLGWNGFGINASYAATVQQLVGGIRNGVAEVGAGSRVSGSRVNVTATLTNATADGAQLLNGAVLIGK